MPALSKLLRTIGWTTLIALLYFAFKLYKVKQSVSWAEKIPTEKKHWLLGSIPYYGSHNQAYQTRTAWGKKFKTAYVFWASSFYPIVVLTNTHGARQVLQSDSPKSIIYSFLKEWLGKGLITSSGNIWFRSRKLITPAFHFDALKQYVEVMQDCTDIFVENLKQLKGEKVDITHHTSKLALDVICRCALSYQTDCQTREESNTYSVVLHKLSYEFIERTKKPWLFPDFIFFNLPCGKRFLNYLSIMRSITIEVIKSRKEEKLLGLKSQRKYQDFLDIMLESKDEEGQALTEEEIQHQVDTFVFAGHDTTSSGMSWIFYCLAKYPHFQDIIRDEIMSVYGQRDRLIHSDLSQLTFTHMFIKEVFRLYPPVPVIQRVLPQEITLNDKSVVKSGGTVDVSPLYIHRDPDYWERPDEFDPYRFSIENSKSRDPYCYIPFSLGPRNCIGQNFAINEEKLATCSVLRNFRIELTDEEPMPEELVVLRSENGINLRFIPLN